MGLSFSPQQHQALEEVRRWLRSDQQIFRLFGFAGTGKTTLARAIADEAGSDQVLAAAYTGKAAKVLRGVGFPGATTIHSLIYLGGERSRARLLELEAKLAQAKLDDPELEELRREIEKEREALSRPAFTLNPESAVKRATLTIIDECSMVDSRVGGDLLSFGTKVLVLGDPAQLPPVHGSGFFTAQKPHVMLTEIHRQAADNPIIAMATTVREGGELLLGDYGQSRVVMRDNLSADELRELAQSADTILVGRNKTRHTLNKRMRQLAGRSGPLPVPDDRLVCLRNNYDLGLLNGGLWTTRHCLEINDWRVALSVCSEDDGTTVDAEAHTQHFLGQGDAIEPWERREAEEFDYGYALTVHKAQGSQWPHVMLFDEWTWTGRREWLYTGLTRAQTRVTVVR